MSPYDREALQQLPCLLDRLSIDHRNDSIRPNREIRTYSAVQQTQGQFRDAVFRDIQNLLNTKKTEWDGAAPEIDQTLPCYGVTDFSGCSFGNKDSPILQLVERAIEAALKNFESRLTNVTVRRETPDPQRKQSGAKPGETGGALAPEVRFVVRARLLTNPNPEDIQFTTTLRQADCSFKIEGAGDR